VRDFPLEVRYDDWQSAGALSFPNSVQLYASGLLLWEETRTSVELEPTLPDDHFALSAEVDMSAVDAELLAYGELTSALQEAFSGGLGFNYAPVAGLAPAAELAPGLTLLGSGANTLLVETTDGIIVIEAPTSPDHGSAIVSATNELFPDSPITHIIQSHDDVDHASGVRSLVAAGATAVVGNGAADFWAQVLSAESTISPDALAAAGVTGVVEELEAGGSLTVADDGDISVTVYHVANPHSNDMVITAIETDGQLYVYEGDLYNAGLGGTLVIDGPASLFDAMRDIGLIDASCGSAVPLTIIPAHGFPFTLADSIAELADQGQEIGC
jgi:glyoxylase-like metal-dependent hydrolase (beta-lactamase superfamily II)